MTLLSSLSFVSVTKKMARTQNFPSKRQHRTVGTIITIPRASTLLQFLKREECWEGGGGESALGDRSRQLGRVTVTDYWRTPPSSRSNFVGLVTLNVCLCPGFPRLIL